MLYWFIFGFILLLPFYAFLGFVYLRVLAWEKIVSRVLSHPQYRDDVKKIANAAETVVMERAVPIVVDKFDQLLGILQNGLDRLNRIRLDDRAPDANCESRGR